jgi:hypothetical protein
VLIAPTLTSTFSESYNRLRIFFSTAVSSSALTPALTSATASLASSFAIMVLVAARVERTLATRLRLIARRFLLTGSARAPARRAARGTSGAGGDSPPPPPPPAEDDGAEAGEDGGVGGMVVGRLAGGRVCVCLRLC